MSRSTTFFYTHWFAVAFLATGLIIGGGILAYAQTATTQTANGADQGAALRGITFPIPELGNCGDEGACRAYCNDTVHIDACVSFAETHGLMNRDEASQAKKFKQVLQSGGGPGGCTNPQDCQTFCSNTANLEVCVKFAKDHGVKDQNVDQGEKILAYVKSGGHMPGNCSSKESCQAYCGDFSHAEECFNFAKNAGIAQTGNGPGGGNGGGGNEPTPEQVRKFLDLAKNGQTPGGCTSKDACEAYCQTAAHRDECVAFGVKAGFIKPEEADMIKKSGGAGPGGCNSNGSCNAYCNDQSHRDECYKFAEDHGFINHSQTQQAKEGLVSLRAGLEQAPPEVTACLKSTLGSNIIDDIQSGNLVPGSDIGERVRDCFEKFGRRGDPGEVFKNAPPEIIACLKDKIGSRFDDISSGKIMPTPEIADAFRVCFQQAQIQNGLQGQPVGPQGFGGPGGQGNARASEEMFKNFIKTAPPEILPCIQQQLGDDFNKIQAGQDVQIDTSKLKGCFENFRPQFQQGGGESLQGEAYHGIAPEKGKCSPGWVLETNNSRVYCAPTQAKCEEEHPGTVLTTDKSGFKVCWQKAGNSEPQDNGESGSGRGFNAPSSFPSDVLACLKQTVGDAAVVQLQSGQMPGGDFAKAMQQCSVKLQGSSGQNIQPPAGQNLPLPYSGQQYPSGTYPNQPAPGAYPPPPGATYPNQPSSGTYPYSQPSPVGIQPPPPLSTSTHY